jgi:hypothetical protein
MTQSLMWIGFGAFFVASLTVGVRLVALWWENRQLPELLIGLGVLGIGPVGFGCVTLGQILQTDHGVAAGVVFGAGVLAASGGAFAQCFFNYAVYHPDSRVVKEIVRAIGAALLACYLWLWLSGGFVQAQERVDASYAIRSLLNVGCLLWGSIEALRYWRMMRRRTRLELADPVVTNRFFLWGVGAGAAGVGTAVGTAAQMWTGRPPLEIPWVTLSSSMHGLVAAVAMWFAFLPTQAYRHFLLERAERRLRA